ncbi:MAG: hypothetical protein H6697_10685 [Myxococcales bacterium]|nr:hypothetical protein [Myxococcales bacterium]
MCGLSGYELLVVVVVAIVLTDPAKLPELMARAGKLGREVKRLRSDLGALGREIQRSEVATDLRKAVVDDPELARMRQRTHDVEAEIDALRARLKQVADGVQSGSVATVAGALPTIETNARPSLAAPSSAEASGPEAASARPAGAAEQGPPSTAGEQRGDIAAPAMPSVAVGEQSEGAP